MTIKQQGGIFGRNPSFNEVEAEDIQTTKITATNAGVPITSVRTNSDGSMQDWYRDASKIVDVASFSGDVWFRVTNKAGLRFSGTSLIPLSNGSVSDAGISLGSPIYRFNTLYMSGNVVIGSGSGIDFSATSGTGTSELFDDYEEGTFTATLEGTVNPATKVTTTAYYTKIGRVVQFEIAFEAVDTTGYSGNVSISGLPFTAARRTPQSILAYNSVNWTGTPVPLTAPGSTLLSVFSIDSGNVWTWATHDAGASRYINIAGSYTAA